MKYLKLRILATTMSALTLIACVSSAGKKSGPKPLSPEELAEAPPLTLMVAANDSSIRYTGRIDFSDPEKPAFAYPGTCIEASFSGSGIDVVLGDQGHKNYVNVSIDGAKSVSFRPPASMKPMPVARGLSAGQHSIRISKRTESSVGNMRFGGFMLEEGAGLLPSEYPNQRRLEFIGDSITCGYGNMVSTTSPNDFHFTPANEDVDLSWAGQTASALQARLMVTAYSGRGVFRNNDGSEQGTLPKIYSRIFPDDAAKPEWDFSAFHPDAIVINLGTNDMSAQIPKTDLKPQEFDKRFLDSYRLFIGELRRIHGPDTQIICVVGPMISDYYPAGLNSWTRIQRSVSGLVAELNHAGDAKVHYLMLDTQNPPYGEDWHPTVSTHELMTDSLVPLLKEVCGW